MAISTTCSICSFTAKSISSLSIHLRKRHTLTLENYWLIDNEKSLCLECGHPTIFDSYNIGYKRFCSQRCAGTTRRKEQLLDPIKEQIFRKKVSENQKAIWDQRKKDGTSHEIRLKIGKTIKAQRRQMTALERFERFNFNPNGYSKSLLDWHKNATEEQKVAMISKRLRSIVTNRKSSWTQEDIEKFDLKRSRFFEKHPTYIYDSIMKKLNEKISQT